MHALYSTKPLFTTHYSLLPTPYSLLTTHRVVEHALSEDHREEVDLDAYLVEDGDHLQAWVRVRDLAWGLGWFCHDLQAWG